MQLRLVLSFCREQIDTRNSLDSELDLFVSFV